MKRKTAQKERTFFQFRLREVDADLKAAIDGMSGEQLANAARDGLRLMLGIRTTKKVQVVDVPIASSVSVQPSQEPQTRTTGTVIGNQGLSTSFISQDRRNNNTQPHRPAQPKRT